MNICTRWYKIALSREHVVPIVGGFIFATHFPVGLFDGFFDKCNMCML